VKFRVCDASDNAISNSAAVFATTGGTLTMLSAVRGTIDTGPSYWNVDLAVSRQPGLVGMQTLELRLEAFNLFNTFNWGQPGTELTAGGWIAPLNSGQFGRITTQAGTPRIIQLGVKYAF